MSFIPEKCRPYGYSPLLDVDVTVEFKVIFQILTGMAGASSQVFFEGTEKLLEVWFSSDSESPDLRDVKQLVSAIFFCTGFTYNRIYSLLNKFSSYRQLYCSLSLLILKCVKCL